MQANTKEPLQRCSHRPALLVADTTGVSVSGLIVDGANNGISHCAPDLIGISFQNASGQLDRMAVRNFKLGASLNGCQSGTGIFLCKAATAAPRESKSTIAPFTTSRERYHCR